VIAVDLETTLVFADLGGVNTHRALLDDIEATPSPSSSILLGTPQR